MIKHQQWEPRVCVFRLISLLMLLQRPVSVPSVTRKPTLTHFLEEVTRVFSGTQVVFLLDFAGFLTRFVFILDF